jgi:hypothetical protein
MFDKRIFIILIIIVLRQSNCFSQTDSIRNYSISAKYGYGFLYAHHKSFEYFIKDYVQSFEVNINSRTRGNKSWHMLYRYPTVGYGYKFSTLSNNQILGNANALFTFISIPIAESKNLKFSYKCAGGVAWLSKKFDLYSNNSDIAIGSKLNAYLNINLDLDFRIIDKMHLILGGGLSHYSNGGFKQPNKGLNIFSVQTGLVYQMTQEQFPKRFDSIPKFKKTNKFSIIYSAGLKGLEPARTRKYFVSGLALNAERQFGYKSRIGIGLDLFKDNSRKEYLKTEGIENPVTKDLFYAGSHFSYDFVFGKTSFTIQMGVYIWQKAKYYQTTYNRFGIKYQISDHLLANLTLKTYWAAADFTEWGIGYRF